jgi:hypothetical protein
MKHRVHSYAGYRKLGIYQKNCFTKTSEKMAVDVC